MQNFSSVEERVKSFMKKKFGSVDPDNQEFQQFLAEYDLTEDDLWEYAQAVHEKTKIIVEIRISTDTDYE